MDRREIAIFVILLAFSLFGLWTFSPEVQSVNIVGLFASGALAGVALAGIMSVLRSKRRP
jgi:hypothetical protein